MAEALPIRHDLRYSGSLLSPSLKQSKTSLTHGSTASRSEYSSLDTIDSCQTIEYESEASECSSSSSSSDWDARTTMSTVSTASAALLQHKKKNATVVIKPLHSQIVLDELNESSSFDPSFTKSITQRDLTYDLYSLFYPYTNLQSLLFSHLHPYIESDYKKIKTENSANEEDLDQVHYADECDANMDWCDIASVIRIESLITKLLSSSSLTTGIKEENIYLMFSSPSPFDIIQHLRFGRLSHLCEVHVDRFGRRSYHYQKPTNQRKKSQLHFYNHSRVPSSMFGDGDIVGLSDFIEEDAYSEISDVDSVHHAHATSIAKIHYHDNDIVMVSPRNSNMEPQIQWQNYAIHSYLYRRTRITADASIASPPSIKKQISPPQLNKKFSNSRHVARYGVSMTPKMYGSRSLMNQKQMFSSSQSSLMNKKKNVTFKVVDKAPKTQNRKHARDVSAFLEKAQKEGFLEKQNTRSYTNIMNLNQWTKFWCVLWNTTLLIYAKSARIPYTQSKHGSALSPKTETGIQPIQRINLDDIMLPIPISYDTTNRYYVFRLNHVNGKQYYVFRTKSAFQRKSWVGNIELMLNNDTNFGELSDGRRTTNEKPASCLMM